MAPSKLDEIRELLAPEDGGATISQYLVQWYSAQPVLEQQKAASAPKSTATCDGSPPTTSYHAQSSARPSYVSRKLAFQFASFCVNQ